MLLNVNKLGPFVLNFCGCIDVHLQSQHFLRDSLYVTLSNGIHVTSTGPGGPERVHHPRTLDTVLGRVPLRVHTAVLVYVLVLVVSARIHCSSGLSRKLFVGQASARVLNFR